jgi:hypothetical protein
MSLIDENMAEQAALDGFEALGCERAFGSDVSAAGVAVVACKATMVSV